MKRGPCGARQLSAPVRMNFSYECMSDRCMSDEVGRAKFPHAALIFRMPLIYPRRRQGDRIKLFNIFEDLVIL